MYRASSFLEHCEVQSIQLHPVVEDALAAESPDSVWPEAIFFAVGLIGVSRTLNKTRRKRRLANRVFKPTPAMLEDTPARSLASFINDSIQPKAPQDSSLALRNESSPLPVATCPDAEPRFLKTLAALEHVTPEAEVPEGGCQIIVIGQRPLIIRKRIGEDTGLTLESLIVGGIEYPAGTIVALRIKPTEGAEKDAYPERRRADIIPVEQVKGIEFGRLSALALTPLERSELPDLKDSPEYTDESSRLYDEITIGKIRAVASRAIGIVQTAVNT